jgi:hypothetical protein
MQLRTGLMLLAALALPLSFARNATHRFRFCWQQQAMFAAQEQRMWAMTSWPKNRPVHAEEAANDSRRRKWRYRWEALRFWEPSELIESEPYNR